MDLPNFPFRIIISIVIPALFGNCRYEFFVQSEEEKTTLKGTFDIANVTKVRDTDVRYLIRDNYIALHDFSILQVRCYNMCEELRLWDEWRRHPFLLFRL